MTRPFRCVRSSQRRKRLLNVDLNAMPLWENLNHEGTSSRVDSLDATPVQRLTLTSEPIDVEGLDDGDDDDVIILSPRAFAEAKNNPRRNRGGAIVVDVDSEERPCRVASTNTYKRRNSITNQPVMNSQMCINLDGYNKSQGKNDGSLMLLPAPPPLPPKEAVFNCPVCMGPLVEEMSTKCGHIFCKVCIKASIDAQGKCPTCRRKITMKSTIRVYLPSTS